MKQVKIHIIYDNTSCRKDLIADWGFAAYVETDNRHILFDTGSDGRILLGNMSLMSIDPKQIDTVFISHHHFDHTGGLAAFLHENSDVQVIVPKSLRGVRRAREVIHVESEYTVDRGIFSTGELMDIEQSLVIETPAGLVVVVGCSHPGLERIISAAEFHGRIHALVGGFHGFSQYEILKDIDYVCPTHCTQHIKDIAFRYPTKYIHGGAGTQLTFPKTTGTT
ncbi:MBL fold metallo-hydrolase [Fidelibacter multiformis]|uniref:MBL fold metallo-hydrolase n=1 Tax=Fidelibacter multiformis TaxID=3377529 RepID=UPI0037DC5F18